jgi:5-methylcytosine-specific restriction enzyme A
MPKPNRWSDEELSAAVEAYLEMLEKEETGVGYNKANTNRNLRNGILRNRTQQSIERRMQNISSVFEDLSLPHIQGYRPARNVGTNVSEKIKNLVFDKGIFPEPDFEPSSDEQILNTRTLRLRKRGISGIPLGQLKPKYTSTQTRDYLRDPRVRAWVLENASGVCELCGLPAPFLDSFQEPYLEVHHVLALAQGGSDTITNAVALCPNCHSRCHRSADREMVKGFIYEHIHRLVKE